MSDFLPLAGLALVDSLSAGTLVIPIALIVIWRRVRLGLLGTYLATIATAYCCLGIASIRVRCGSIEAFWRKRD